MEKIGTLGLQFIGFIVSQRRRERRLTTATFINKCNCLIARDWAILIENYERLYIAESPMFLKQEQNEIDSVFYKKTDDDVAAYWGVVKVSYKIEIHHMTLHKVVHNRNIYLKYHFCCCDSKECL